MADFNMILNEDGTAPATSTGSSNVATLEHGTDKQSRSSLRSKRMSLNFIAPPDQPSQQTADSCSTHDAVENAPHGYGTDSGIFYNSGSDDSALRSRPRTAAMHTYPSPQSSLRKPDRPISTLHLERAPGTAQYFDRHLANSAQLTSNIGSHREQPSESTSVPARIHNSHREPRHTYDEEERAFIMVCAILRNMTWKEVEGEFCKRFPAGQVRRHQGAGLLPTYPRERRTASGLTCVYYRIREAWGIPKVRGVSDEKKPEVKLIVKRKLMEMHDFPDLQAFAQD